MQVSDQVVVVDEFKKNHRETIRTSLFQFKGRSVVDIRVWLPRSDGQLVPCPKGLTIDQQLLPELANATREALAYLEKQKAIPQHPAAACTA